MMRISNVIRNFTLYVPLSVILVIIFWGTIYAVHHPNVGERSVLSEEPNQHCSCNKVRDNGFISNENTSTKENTFVDFDGQCSVRTVMTTLYDPQKPLTVSDVNLLRGCIALLFFRNPRCGTTAIYLLLNELSNNLGYQSILRNPMPVEPKQKNWVEYVNNITKTKQFVAVTGHWVSMDVISDAIRPPVVFNMFRHPIEHLMSIFKVRKYGDRSAVQSANQLKKAACNMTFDEYIARHGFGEPCIIDSYMGLHYLCGTCYHCTREECVARAKKNLESNYLVVGLTENIPAFLTVMETLLPQFFHRGLEKYVNQSGLYQMFTPDTYRNETLSPKTKRYLDKTLAPDFEIYYYVRSRFYLALKKVLEYKANQHLTDNNLLYNQILPPRKRVRRRPK